MTRETVRAEDALRHAFQALTDGPADPRTVDGAQVNALQSIAWSLIGILAKDVDGKIDADESMAELLERTRLMAQLKQ